MSARRTTRSRYGTGGASGLFGASTAVLSPLERFYGPPAVEVPGVPACPACGGRPCPGCGAVALDLFGGTFTTAKCPDPEEVQEALFSYREM